MYGFGFPILQSIPMGGPSIGLLGKSYGTELVQREHVCIAHFLPEVVSGTESKYGN